MSDAMLDQAAIEKQLSALALEWTVVGGNQLQRVYTFDDFKAAAKFVQQVAHIADEAGHHPDIHLSWGRVEITITTHSVGGLTKKDFALAKELS